jgi:hypothetical protein
MTRSEVRVPHRPPFKKRGTKRVQKQNDTATYTAVFVLLLVTVGAKLFTDQSTTGRILTVVSILIIAACMAITLMRSK